MRGIAVIVLFAGFLVACGGPKTVKSPLDQLKQEYSSKHAYTILLQDMDLKGEKLMHKYTVIEFKKDRTYSVKKTKWYQVEEDFFRLHESNLGMEVLSKVPGGDYNNLPSPPGFTQIIGDSTYGFWESTIASIDTTEAGAIDTFYFDVQQSRWKFHEPHAALAKNLEIETMEIQFFEWEEFKGSFHLNRPYYGADQNHADSTRYGTHSRHWFFHRSGFYSRRSRKDNFYTSNMRSSASSRRGGGGFGK